MTYSKDIQVKANKLVKEINDSLDEINTLISKGGFSLSKKEMNSTYDHIMDAYNNQTVDKKTYLALCQKIENIKSRLEI